MSKTNCVNCGHGKDPGEIKCPFCGTTYFDMTGIDITMDEPVVLMLKDPRSGNILQLLAHPNRFNVEFGFDEPVICNVGFFGNKAQVFTQHEPEIDVDIEFVGR